MATPAKSSHFTTEGDQGPLIGALLRVPLDAVRTRMLTRLHESGFDDFEPAHFTVFRYPSPDGERPSELAARLGISKQALNYLLGELERLGYLEREQDPDDLRGKRVVVTRRGQEATKVIRAAVAELEREWAEQLGTRRFAQFRSLLIDLNRLV
jgi:DNA-binding MarR family transcriptional regulator